MKLVPDYYLVETGENRARLEALLSFVRDIDTQIKSYKRHVSKSDKQ